MEIENELNEIKDEYQGNTQQRDDGTKYLQYLETLKLRNQEATSNNPLKCFVKMSNKYCQCKGKESEGYFCGKHKSNKDNEVFKIIIELLKNNRIEDLEKEKTKELLSLEHQKKEIEKKLQQTTTKLKEIKEERKKIIGRREEEFWNTLNELKIKTEMLYGECTLTGNNCNKVLNNWDQLVNIFRDHPQLHASYSGLFFRFAKLIRIIERIEPFPMIKKGPEELELEFKNIAGANDYINLQIDFKEECFEFGHYFLQNFKKIPTPKHHFLVFHSHQFIERHGSLGMFSEQGIEKTHSFSNLLERKLKPMNEIQRQKRKFQEMNLRCAATKKVRQ